MKWGDHDDQSAMPQLEGCRHTCIAEVDAPGQAQGPEACQVGQSLCPVISHSRTTAQIEERYGSACLQACWQLMARSWMSETTLPHPCHIKADWT